MFIVFASIIKSSTKCTCMYAVDERSRQHFQNKNIGRIKVKIICLFVFVALRPKSTAMVIAGRSVRLTTLFPWQVTSNSCTYFRL